jgi:hypothetical protein
VGLLVALTVSGCSGPTFKDYPSPEGGYTIQLPGPPKEMRSGKLVVRTFDHRHGTYAVVYHDIPAPVEEQSKESKDSKEKSKEIEDRLVGAQNGAVNKLGGTLIQDKKIQLGERHPGRVFLADLPDKRQLHERLYLVGGRLYQVLVLGEKAWVETREADQFLDSFALLK